MEGGLVPTDDHFVSSNKTPLDLAIARLAERQYNVVTREQLEDLGLARSTIRSRAAAGRLHPLYRAVYAVGSRRLTKEGHFLAAVYACGPQSWLSYRASADHWGFRPSAAAKIDVTSRTQHGRRYSGIRLHSGATLTRADITVHDGIPCTTVARTLLDSPTCSPSTPSTGRCTSPRPDGFSTLRPSEKPSPARTADAARSASATCVPTPATSTVHSPTPASRSASPSAASRAYRVRWSTR
jgi:Transcriptional regulator, AbiEi antitoxin